MGKWDNLDGFVIDGYPVKHYGWEDGTKKKDYRALKLTLLEKYQVCYHCGIKVKDYPQVDGVPLPWDTATIDHLHPRQVRKKYEVTEKVLACLNCNKRLNTAFQSKKGA
jgi:uncharacterized CHY-type Zn-finger protein